MSDDVLITPASRKIEFKDSGGNIDGKIELDGSGNLQITSTGLIGIGDTSEDIHIGDGTQAVDLVFDYASRLYSVANQDLTIGKSSLSGNDIVIDSPNWSVSSAGTASFASISGNLGINTTSPSTTLHVAKSGTNDLTALTLDNGLDTDGGKSVGMDLRVRYGSSNIASAYIGFDYYGTKLTSNSHGMIYRSGRAGFAHHHFVADDNTRQMMISDSGKVGIGSGFNHGSQPAAPLHVGSPAYEVENGIYLTNSNQRAVQQVIHADDANTNWYAQDIGLALHNTDNTNNNWSPHIVFSTHEDDDDSPSNANPVAVAAISATYNTRNANSWASGALVFFTNNNDGNVERMRITEAGQLVVGASSASLTTANHGVIEVCGSTQANFRATDTSGALHTDFAHSANDTWIVNRVAAGKIYIKPGNGTNSLELASNGQVKFNNEYTFPTSDGSANQVLQTNGSGALSFATVSGGGSIDADSNLANNPTWTVTSTSGMGLYITRNQSSGNMDNDMIRVREDSPYADQAAFWSLHDGGDQMNQQDFGRCAAVIASGTGVGTTFPLQVANSTNTSTSSDYAGVGIKFKLSGWGNTEEGRKFSSIAVVSQTSWSRKHKMVFKVYGSSSSNQDVETAMTIKDNLEIDGNFNDTSDRALKSNIKTIPNGLGLIEKLNPVTFDWNVKVNNQPSAGFIAQEVEEVLPDLVRGIEGEKTIKTAGIVGYLVKAVQELSARVKELEGGN